MIGEALRLIRSFHDMTQAEVAQKIDISKSYLSELENGKKEPSLDIIHRYSECFNLPMSAILLFAEQIPEARKGKGLKAAVAGKALSILRFIEARAKHA